MTSVGASISYGTNTVPESQVFPASYYDGGVFDPGSCHSQKVTLINDGDRALIITSITTAFHSGLTELAGGVVSGSWHSYTDYIFGALTTESLIIEAHQSFDVNFWLRNDSSVAVVPSGIFDYIIEADYAREPEPDGTLYITKYAGGPVPGVIANGSRITDPAVLAQLGTGTERPPVPGVKYSAFGFYGINGESDWDRVEHWGAALNQALQEGGDTWDFFLNTMLPYMTGTAWTRDQLLAIMAGAPESVYTSEPTDVNGETTLVLPNGTDGDGIMYFVWESETPCELPGQAPELCAWPGQPFFITVPRDRNSVYPEGYETWVYPKNEILAVHKDLIDEPGGSVISRLPAGHKIGDDIHYRVTMNIPALSSLDEITQLRLEDRLADPNGLNLFTGYQDLVPTLKPSVLSEPTSWGDWDADWWECDPLFTGSVLWQAYLRCGLTSDGLEWINDVAHSINQSGDVRLVFEFTVKVWWQGQFPNGENNTTYFLWLGGMPGPYEYRPNTVTVAYGGFSIWKYDQFEAARMGTSEEAMSAAGVLPAGLEIPNTKFAVYAGGCPTVGLPVGEPLQFYPQTNDWLGVENIYPDNSYKPYWQLPGAGISDTVPGISFSLPTGPDGQLIIGGLAYGTYCVREVAANPQFALPTASATLHEIRIDKTADGQFFKHNGECAEDYPSPGDEYVLSRLVPYHWCADSDWNESPTYYADDLLIPNSPKNAGFPFPITGGSSSLLYAIVAGAVLIGTAYVVRRQRVPEGR